MYLIKKYFFRLVLFLAAGLVLSFIFDDIFLSKLFTLIILIVIIVEIIFKIYTENNDKTYNAKDILKGFPVIFHRIKRVKSFYQDSLIDFIWMATICIVIVILIGGDKFGIYENINFVDEKNQFKGFSLIFAEVFVKNLRFFVYESIVIGLFGYCLKKISYCISMIENYKELEVFLFIDVQRQQIKDSLLEKDTVSQEFKEKFCKMFLSGKNGINSEDIFELKASDDILEKIFKVFKNK